METKDWRPLFKMYMAAGYFKKKARQFKVERHTISNILSGRTKNPTILDECLKELREKMDARASAIARVRELTQTHRELQELRRPVKKESSHTILID